MHRDAFFARKLPFQTDQDAHTAVIQWQRHNCPVDFFSSVDLTKGGGIGNDGPPPGASATAASTATDPIGALSLFDAVSKQLGLKLEKQRRPVPVLVIDHIEEKPTEN
jgi:uncharacterized protein (TIGR03435 family)